MARGESPPFERGCTLGMGAGTLERYAGSVWTFDDVLYKTLLASGLHPARTNRPVRCLAVLNKTGGFMQPMRAYQLKKTGSILQAICEMSLVAPVDADMAFVADEFLPSNFCQDGDCCFVVIEGPHKALLASGQTSTVGGLLQCAAAGELKNLVGGGAALNFEKLCMGVAMQAVVASGGNPSEVVVYRSRTAPF